MMEQRNPRHNYGGVTPPNPLEFPIKDPVVETYEGRWKQLPAVQKAGVIVVLGFWCFFIATLSLSEGRAHYLNWLMPIFATSIIIGLLLWAFRKKA